MEFQSIFIFVFCINLYMQKCMYKCKSSIHINTFWMRNCQLMLTERNKFGQSFNVYWGEIVLFLWNLKLKSTLIKYQVNCFINHISTISFYFLPYLLSLNGSYINKQMLWVFFSYFIQPGLVKRFPLGSYWVWIFSWCSFFSCIYI